MPASPAAAMAADPELPTHRERAHTMTKRRNITFKVWLEIERFNEKTGDSENMDAPGSSLAAFGSYE